MFVFSFVYEISTQDENRVSVSDVTRCRRCVSINLPNESNLCACTVNADFQTGPIFSSVQKIMQFLACFLFNFNYLGVCVLNPLQVLSFAYFNIIKFTMQEA